MTAAQAYAYDPARLAALRGCYRGHGPLERDFYTAQDVFNADLERIWRRHWLFAGHGCEMPRAGDWKSWTIGFDQVLLVRGRDGEVRAFHNVCRHRGARICAGEKGQNSLLVCPYHAWTYDLDGSLRTATETEFGRVRSELGLKPIALQNIGDLLFVALGDEPVSFERAANEIAAEMRHQGFADAKLATSIRYTVKANWKLVFENNRECYHCGHAHPEYVAGTYDFARFDVSRGEEIAAEERHASQRFQELGLAAATASSAMSGDFWRVTRAPLMAGWKTQSLDGTPIAPLMGTMRKKNTWSEGTLRCTVFPNFWQHASDDHAVATRLTPVDPTTTQVDVSWFVHKDATEGRDYTLKRLLPFWQRTSEQDWSICAANQEGVSSPAYTPGPYSKTREANVQQFVDWYLDALVPDRDTPRATERARRG